MSAGQPAEDDMLKLLRNSRLMDFEQYEWAVRNNHFELKHQKNSPAPKKPKRRFRPRLTSLQKRRNHILRQMTEMLTSISMPVVGDALDVLREAAICLSQEALRPECQKPVVLSARGVDSRCLPAIVLAYVRMFPCNNRISHVDPWTTIGPKDVCVVVRDNAHRRVLGVMMERVTRQQGILIQCAKNHSLLRLKRNDDVVRVNILTCSELKDPTSYRGSSFGPIHIGGNCHVFSCAVFVADPTVTAMKRLTTKTTRSDIGNFGVHSWVGIYSFDKG